MLPVLAGLIASSLGAVSPVVATPADETSPATNGRDLAWTRGSQDGPVIVMKLGAVFLRRGGGHAVRVSPRGARAASGGMDERTLVVGGDSTVLDRVASPSAGEHLVSQLEEECEREMLEQAMVRVRLRVR